MKKIFTLLLLIPLFGFGQVEGTWKMAPIAGALGVGPTMGDISWWSNNLADVSTRACYFDDEFVFAEDGTFTNVLGDETWVEPWQGMDPEACGAPVAPHNGSNPATWAYDAEAGTITLTGVGAYLGLPKVINLGEISDPADAPESIVYPVTFSEDGETMYIDIDIATGYWHFVITKGTPPPPPDNTLVLPITFDDPEQDYRLVGFGGTENEIVADPADAENSVLQIIRTDGAETWAGTTIGEGPGLVDPVPFTETLTHMSMMVWSPAADIPILFKMENSSDGSIAVETVSNTTTENSWERISFDFSNTVEGTPELDLANEYNKPVVFFNFGVTGADAGEMIFFIDDIKFGQGPEGIFENSITQLNVFPNPAQDVLYIKNNTAINSISIYSVSGQLMIKSDNINSSIDISNLSPGLYTLSAIDNDGQNYQSKFVVK